MTETTDESKALIKGVKGAAEQPTAIGWEEGKGTSVLQGLFIAVIGLAISACEYVFAYYNVAYGIIIALVLSLAIFIIISVVRLIPPITATAESLAIIPLYILFTSSLPWFFINQQALLPAVYTCILGLCAWHIYHHNVNVKSLFGFRKNKLFIKITIGSAMGLVLGTIEYLILKPAPTFPTFQVLYLLRDIVYMLVFVALAEEVLFRGLIQRDLGSAFGWKWGLFGSAALFGVMHLTWRSIPELGFVFFAGLVLGFVYWKTRELTIPVIIHAMNNVMLVAIAPYVFR
jgi:membrane protease YdiL (CAAX protease family)